jgi:DNA-binding NarL/FixJ family response regulator
MNATIRLMIVDDHPLARQGVIAMLNAYDDRFTVVAQAGSIDEALANAKTAHPEVVLTDLHLGPGEARNGLDLIALLQQDHPDLQCVMITSEVNDQFLLKAHDAGVSAYLHKHATAAEIVRAIESVASGFTHFPSHLKTALDKREREPVATQRELELLPLIARGMTAKEIARELSHLDPNNPLMDRTVEVHKGNIKRKFHLDSANSLITFAIEFCQDHRIDYRSMQVQTKRPAT